MGILNAVLKSTWHDASVPRPAEKTQLGSWFWLSLCILEYFFKVFSGPMKIQEPHAGMSFVNGDFSSHPVTLPL